MQYFVREHIDVSDIVLLHFFSKMLLIVLLKVLSCLKIASIKTRGSGFDPKMVYDVLSKTC